MRTSIILLLLILSVSINAKSKKRPWVHNGQILDSICTNYIGFSVDANWDGNTKTIKDITKKDIRTTSISLGFGGDGGGMYFKGGMSNMNQPNKSGVFSIGWVICPVENRLLGYYMDGGLIRVVGSEDMKSVISAGVIINLFYQHITVGATIYDLKQTKVSVGILL